MLAAQRCLFEAELSRVDPDFRGIRRIELEEGAWIEHLPGWLAGHERLFRDLRSRLAWRGGEREMYERTVVVPRLMASIPDDGAGVPPLGEITSALEGRYGTRFEHVHLHRYRDGQDSVAMHADTGIDSAGASEREAILPILSLGTPRRFLVRPTVGARRRGLARAPRARSFRLGWGDLFVMGGHTATRWEHGVPKVPHVDGERISIMFRIRRPSPS